MANQKLKEVCALWQKKAKTGVTYFTGKIEKGYIKGFYNTKKKNPKEPDLRIILDNNQEDEKSITISSLWCNVSKSGKKYLLGKFNDKKVVGFIDEERKSEKSPYIRIYENDKNTSEPTPEEVKTNDLPF